MYSRFKFLNILNFSVSFFIFSGCSMLEIDENSEDLAVEENSENADENSVFVPLEVESGLIEMEKKDNSIYITPEMVLIPSGTAVINDRVNNNLIKINISYEYFISKYEISFEEYDKFARNTKRALPNDSGWGRGKQPVINVSYDDAVAYAEWLSQKSGDFYRLPSEAEWELAHNLNSLNLEESEFEIGSHKFFNGGVENLKYYGWFSENSAESTHQIGAKMPNSWNIYDTIGNVWEWCQDSYQQNLIGIPTDGKPRQNKKSDEKVVKGGSWSEPYQNLKNSNRLGFLSSLKMNDTGFRLIMETRQKKKILKK